MLNSGVFEVNGYAAGTAEVVGRCKKGQFANSVRSN